MDVKSVANVTLFTLHSPIFGFVLINFFTSLGTIPRPRGVKNKSNSVAHLEQKKHFVNPACIKPVEKITMIFFFSMVWAWVYYCFQVSCWKSQASLTQMSHNDALSCPRRLKTVTTQAASCLELFIGGSGEEGEGRNPSDWTSPWNAKSETRKHITGRGPEGGD